tara:strand:+ start:627 stop:1826 length:1200 start_codon:yes stop_codon:yes gene_type:complete
LSKKKHLFNSDFDPLDQISLLKEKCNNISPVLYRVYSFYLEEVRNFLPQTIRTSLYSLITDRLGDQFGFSTVSSRKIFQLKIDKLVGENISLITIEHLNELSNKIEAENIHHINNAKDEISNVLNKKNNLVNSKSSSEVNSINISLIPPLENLSITEGWNGELEAPYSIEDKEIDGKSKILQNDDIIEKTNNESNPLKEDVNNFDNLNLKSNDIEILQSIFALTDESNSSDIDLKTEESSHDTISCENVKNNRFFPQSPIALYEWMISIDTSLARRLRDLSHSINTELLKSGLVNTLVPINILDAALSGQLISSKSISNILSFKLPTNNPLTSGGLEIDCLLITPSDMEFDNPRLRKNRTNIKHYQNVLLAMIKQQRYWQGRSIAEEVDKEWWKDTTKI